ncbi:DNA-binding protein [Massilia sp. PWRC2]|uniref:DNA-binding protein n=1 Tax=Massilia sp. PWRC2 TaxID=2804626 RepID=UPI003CF2F71D
MTQDHKSEMPETLTTAAAAAAFNRKPHTLNRWAWTNTGPVKPVRINGRLAWPAAAIADVLRGVTPCA